MGSPVLWSAGPTLLKWGGTPLFDASERPHRRQDNLQATLAQFATGQPALYRSTIVRPKCGQRTFQKQTWCCALHGICDTFNVPTYRAALWAKHKIHT